MKLPAVRLGVFCFVLALAGCGASFQEFSPDGKFKCQMPGKPEDKSQSAMGLMVKIWAIGEGNGAYLVSATDLPVKPNDGEIDQMLVDSGKGQLQGMGSSMKTSNKITLGGKYKGLQVEGDVPSKNGAAIGRIYIVGSRLYQMLVVGKSSFVTSGDATKFLDSLEIIKE